MNFVQSIKVLLISIIRYDLHNEKKLCTSEPSLAHTGVLWETINHLALASGSIQTL